jgi:hypothetical protein
VCESIILVRQPAQPLLLFPLKSAQDGIDNAHRPGFSQEACTLGSFIDGGMLCGSIFPELEQADQDQPVNVPVTPLQWALQQIPAQPLDSAKPTHHTKSQVAGECAIPRITKSVVLFNLTQIELLVQDTIQHGYSREPGIVKPVFLHERVFSLAGRLLAFR